MPSKRAYRRVSVNQIELESLKEQALLRGGHGTCVGLDVAKAEIVAVIRWADKTFECPWSIKNPSEINLLIERLVMLKECCDSLTVGLESTGTYGEAVRYAMTQSGLEVHRVSGKSTADYKEIFDGVPSQHDGKDAAIIAELTCFGKGTSWPWQMLDQAEQETRHQVQRLDAFRAESTRWIGRVEGLLAKHWPEANGLLQLNSATLLKVLTHYGSPAQLVADSESAANLRSWSRGRLGQTKIAAIVESARTTTGIPMSETEMTWIGEVAGEARRALDEGEACVKRLKQLAREDKTMSKYVDQIGAVTLSVLWSSVGDPRQYGSSGAFLKALGLNLKELSSGKRKGELAITKRGPSVARRFLYFWAMRAVQRPQLKPWYVSFQRVGKNRNGSSEHRKMKGLIAMMRKLCRSLWYVIAHDLEFDYGKVFPGKPLEKRKRHRRRRRPAKLASPQGSPSLLGVAE